MKQKAEKHSPKTITPQRLRLFKIIAVSIPILFLVILEFSLRVFQYGPDLKLFSIDTVNGKPYYTLNPSVKSRYFNRIHFTPDPSPEYFLVSKPSGTYRIFCLGESTTVGYPYWYNGAFASFLRDRLKTIFPDRSIEVINLGITATNSYTVLDLSRDLMDYDPNLLIVYDGHNEFYGVLGAASNDRVAPARWMTLLYLRMVHLRTFQLANSVVVRLYNLLGKSPIDYTSRSTMMEQVARGKTISFGNDIYKNCFQAFHENLKELADRCLEQHIPLILSTQVSNIRDQHPFVSNHSIRMTEQQQSRFQQSYGNGLGFQSTGLLDSAIVCFRSSVELDTLYADAHYRLAQCLDAKGNKQEAYHEYILARDYDELRFRTDSRFNNLIRSMDNHENNIVADIEMVFQSLSQDSLIGHNLLFEHVHPIARGHFFIAKEYVRLMRSHGLLASADEWARNDTVTDDFLWRHRHVTDLDEFLAARKTEFLTSGWPFKSQPSVIVPIETKDTLRFIAEQAARGQLGWETAHKRAAEFYLQHGDFVLAEKENEAIINQFPWDVAAYLRLAQLHFFKKEFTETESLLLASLNIQETPIAYRILGDIALKQEKPEKAVHYFEVLNKYPPDPVASPENAYMLTLAYLFSQKYDQATRTLEQTIDQYPAYKPARELLTKIKLFEKSRKAP